MKQINHKPYKVKNLLEYGSVQEIPVAQLICDKAIDKRSGSEIVVASVALSGLDPTFPLLVVESPKKDGTYIVVDGRKRLMAAEAHGLEAAICVVLRLGLAKARELAKTVNSVSQQSVSKFTLGRLLLQYLDAAGKDKTKRGRKGLALSKETKKLLIALTGTSNRTIERVATPLRNLYLERKHQFDNSSVSVVLDLFVENYPRSALALFLEDKISVKAFADNWGSENFSPSANSAREEADLTAKVNKAGASKCSGDFRSSIAHDEDINSHLPEPANFLSELEELLNSISSRHSNTKDFSSRIYNFLQQHPDKTSSLIRLSKQLEKLRLRSDKLKNSDFRQKSKGAKYRDPNQRQILFE